MDETIKNRDQGKNENIKDLKEDITKNLKITLDEKLEKINENIMKIQYDSKRMDENNEKGMRSSVVISCVIN